MVFRLGAALRMSLFFTISSLLLSADSARRMVSLRELLDKQEDDAPQGKSFAEVAAVYHSNVSTVVEGQLSVGMLFNGWLLQEKLANFPYGGQLDQLGHRWAKAKVLGRGSFGEAWMATGRINGEEKTVVIKIFYRNTGQKWGESLEGSYLTPGSIDEEEKGEISTVEQECTIVQRIVKAAERRGHIGRNRFVNCYEMHYGEADEPVYVILENGGKSLDNYLNQKAEERPSEKSREEARLIMGHLLQAIQTMSEVLPVKLTHHDIKPANVCFDGKIARLIDFGATMEVTEEFPERHQGTPYYAAPEYLGLNGEQRPYCFGRPWSYDVFALGIIYAQLICPALVKDGKKSLINYARAYDKRVETSPFKGFCEVSDAEKRTIDKMLAFECEERPSPTYLLARFPFSEHELMTKLNEDVSGGPGELEAEPRKRSDSGDARFAFEEAEDVDAIQQSIMHLPHQNNNHAGGRAQIMDQEHMAHALRAGQWVDGTECDRMHKQLDANDRNIYDLKANCETQCKQYYFLNTNIMNDEMDSYNGRMDKKLDRYCCESRFNDRFQGDRECFIGVGSNRYAMWGEVISSSMSLPVRERVRSHFDQAKEILGKYNTVNYACKGSFTEALSDSMRKYDPVNVEECWTTCREKARALRIAACCEYNYYDRNDERCVLYNVQNEHVDAKQFWEGEDAKYLDLRVAKFGREMNFREDVPLGPRRGDQYGYAADQPPPRGGNDQYGYSADAQYRRNGY